MQLEQLAGVGDIRAYAQTGDMDGMLQLLQTGQLAVECPEEVART